ncbi:MAG: PepSY domain-containing protein [Pseudomonadota bacterium]
MTSRRRIRRWHRRIAGFAVAIVLWFALSGILLNHAQDLALDRTPLPDAWSRFFYGASLPETLHGYRLDERWAVVVDDTLHHGTRAIGACAGGLRGAARLGEWHALACTDVVHLVDRDGNPVERIDDSWGLDGAITAIAPASPSAIAIVTTGATRCLDATLGALQDCRAQATPVAAEPVPADARSALADSLAPPAADRERLLHDLHSGRLFGVSARWLWDLFALTLLVLAGSGLWLMRRRHH